VIRGICDLRAGQIFMPPREIVRYVDHLRDRDAVICGRTLDPAPCSRWFEPPFDWGARGEVDEGIS
jgi:hypothetical protein